MKLGNREVARFLSAPKPFRIALFHGEDGGRIRERAQQLRKTLLGADPDPFRELDLSVESLKDDPARLLDEAQAYGFSGQPMVIRVTGVTEAALSAVKNVLAHEAVIGRIVLEAGLLTSKSKLRQLIETSEDAVAVACYADTQRDLNQLVEDITGTYGLRLDPSAKACLMSHLGADHMASRSELEKLCLYAHGKSSLGLADVQACIGDGSQHKIDDAIHAIANGDVAGLENVLGKLAEQGQSPIAVIRRALAYFQKLHLAFGQRAAGKSVDEIARAQRPRLYFRALDHFKRHVAAWSGADIETALDLLFQCEIDLKGGVAGPDLSASRTLLRLAMVARRRRRSQTAGR